MTQLNVARVFIFIGFSVGMASWSFTVSHVGDPTYLLLPEYALGATHGWYHAFREAAGDLAAMFTVLVLFCGPKELRVRASWVICLVVMLGYYAPFWIGMPFLAELSAPNMGAEITHILMAAFAFLGLFIGRGAFFVEADS